MTSNISVFNEINFGRIQDINKYLWGTETCQTLYKHHINGGNWRWLDYHCCSYCWPSSPPSFLWDALFNPQCSYLSISQSMWCALWDTCYGCVFCGARRVSHVTGVVRSVCHMSQVRIICGWRYYFMTSSVKPLKHYGKKLGVNISSCSEILQ